MFQLIDQFDPNTGVILDGGAVLAAFKAVFADKVFHHAMPPLGFKDMQVSGGAEARVGRPYS